MTPGSDENRREFLQRAARWGLLTVSVIGVGGLIGKEGQACDLAPACQVCGRFRDCDLPQAKRSRRAREVK
jgi:hypothetical protein